MIISNFFHHNILNMKLMAVGVFRISIEVVWYVKKKP